MENVRLGQTVKLTPGAGAESLTEKIEDGTILGTVIARSSLGICVVVLEAGTEIEGTSKELWDGPVKEYYGDRHFVDLSEVHLSPAWVAGA